LDARLTTLLCKEIIVAKSKETNTGCNVAESSEEGYSSKRVVLTVTVVVVICREIVVIDLPRATSMQYKVAKGVFYNVIHRIPNGVPSSYESYL
jgi:hypothetical protein